MSSFKILKNLKSNLKGKKILFFVAPLSHCCKLKIEHVFPNNHFIYHSFSTTIYSQVRFKLPQHFNTVSHNIEGISIHFLIKSFLKKESGS